MTKQILNKIIFSVLFVIALTITVSMIEPQPRSNIELDPTLGITFPTPDPGGSTTPPGGTNPDNPNYLQGFYITADVCSGSGLAEVPGGHAQCRVWYSGSNVNQNFLSHSARQEYEYRATGRVRYEFIVNHWESDVRPFTQASSNWFPTDEPELHHNSSMTPVLQGENPRFMYRINEGNERVIHSVFQYVPSWVERQGERQFRASYSFASHHPDGSRVSEQYLRVDDEEYNRYSSLTLTANWETTGTGNFYWGDVSSLYNFERDYRPTGNQRTIYILQHEVPDYTNRDVNGLTASSPSFSTANYFENGKYYVYNSSNSLFYIYDYLSEGTSSQWVNINDPETVSISSTRRLVSLNEAGEQVLRHQRRYEQRIRENYYVVSGQTWLTDGHSNENNYLYTATGEYRYINSFQRTRPVYEGGHEPTAYTQEYYPVSSPPTSSDGGDSYSQTNGIRYTNFFNVHTTTTHNTNIFEYSSGWSSFPNETVINGRYAQRISTQTGYRWNRHIVTVDTNSPSSTSTRNINVSYSNLSSLQTTRQSSNVYGDQTVHYNIGSPNRWSFIRYDRNQVVGTLTHGNSYGSWSRTNPSSSMTEYTDSNGTSYWSDSGQFASTVYTIQSDEGSSARDVLQIRHRQTNTTTTTETIDHGEAKFSLSSISSSDYSGFSSGGSDYEFKRFERTDITRTMNRVNVNGLSGSVSSSATHTINGFSVQGYMISGVWYYDLEGNGTPQSSTVYTYDTYSRSRLITLTFTWQEQQGSTNWLGNLNWNGNIVDRTMTITVSSDSPLYLNGYTGWSSGLSTGGFSRWTRFDRFFNSNTGNVWQGNTHFRDIMVGQFGTGIYDNFSNFETWRSATSSTTWSENEANEVRFRNLRISRDRRDALPNTSHFRFTHDNHVVNERTHTGRTTTSSSIANRILYQTWNDRAFENVSTNTSQTITTNATYYRNNGSTGTSTHTSTNSSQNLSSSSSISFQSTVALLIRRTWTDIVFDETETITTTTTTYTWSGWSNEGTTRTRYYDPSGSLDSGSYLNAPSNTTTTRYRVVDGTAPSPRTYYRTRSASIGSSYQTDYSSYRWITRTSSSTPSTTTSYEYQRGDLVPASRRNGTGFVAFNPNNGANRYSVQEITSTWANVNISTSSNHTRYRTTSEPSVTSNQISNGDTSFTYWTRGDRDNRYTYRIHTRVVSGTAAETGLTSTVGNETNTHSSTPMFTGDPMTDKAQTRVSFSHRTTTHYLYDVFAWDGEQTVLRHEPTGQTTQTTGSVNSSSVLAPGSLSWYSGSLNSQTSRSEMWRLTDRELQRRYDIYEVGGRRTVNTGNMTYSVLSGENYVSPSPSTISNQTKNLFDANLWIRNLDAHFATSSGYTTVRHPNAGATVTSSSGRPVINFNSSGASTTTRSNVPLMTLPSSGSYTISLSGSGNSSAQWEIVNSSGSVITSGNFGSQTTRTFSAPGNRQIGFRVVGSGSNLTINWLQIEQGTSATIYQPHQQAHNRNNYTLTVRDSQHLTEKKQFLYGSAIIWEDTDTTFTYNAPEAYYNGSGFGVSYNGIGEYPHNIGNFPYDQLIARAGSFRSSGAEYYSPSGMSSGYRYRRLTDNNGEIAIEREYEQFSSYIDYVFTNTNMHGNPNVFEHYTQSEISSFNNVSSYTQNVSIQNNDNVTRSSSISASQIVGVNQNHGEYIFDSSSGSLLKRTTNTIYYNVGLFEDQGDYVEEITSDMTYFDYLNDIADLYSMNYVYSRNVVQNNGLLGILTGTSGDKSVQTDQFLRDNTNFTTPIGTTYTSDFADFLLVEKPSSPVYNRYDVYRDQGSWTATNNFDNAFITSEIKNTLNNDGYLYSLPSVYHYLNDSTGQEIHIWAYSSTTANEELENITSSSATLGNASDYTLTGSSNYDQITDPEFGNWVSGGELVYGNDMPSGDHLLLKEGSPQDEYVLQGRSVDYVLRGYSSLRNFNQVASLASPLVRVSGDQAESSPNLSVGTTLNQTFLEVGTITQGDFGVLMTPANNQLMVNGLPNIFSFSNASMHSGGNRNLTDTFFTRFDLKVPQNDRLYTSPQDRVGMSASFITGDSSAGSQDIPEHIMIYTGELENVSLSHVRENFGGFGVPTGQISYSGSSTNRSDGGVPTENKYDGSFDYAPEYEIYSLHSVREVGNSESMFRYDEKVEGIATALRLVLQYAGNQSSLSYSGFLEAMREDFTYNSSTGQFRYGFNLTRSVNLNHSSIETQLQNAGFDPEYSNYVSYYTFNEILASSYLSFEFFITRFQGSEVALGVSFPTFDSISMSGKYEGSYVFEYLNAQVRGDKDYRLKPNFSVGNKQTVISLPTSFSIRSETLSGTFLDNVRSSWANNTDGSGNIENNVYILEHNGFEYIYLRQYDVNHFQLGDMFLNTQANPHVDLNHGPDVNFATARLPITTLVPIATQPNQRQMNHMLWNYLVPFIYNPDLEEVGLKETLKAMFYYGFERNLDAIPFRLGVRNPTHDGFRDVPFPDASMGVMEYFNYLARGVTSEAQTREFFFGLVTHTTRPMSISSGRLPSAHKFVPDTPWAATNMTPWTHSAMFNEGVWISEPTVFAFGSHDTEVLSIDQPYIERGHEHHGNYIVFNPHNLGRGYRDTSFNTTIENVFRNNTIDIDGYVFELDNVYRGTGRMLPFNTNFIEFLPTYQAYFATYSQPYSLLLRGLFESNRDFGMYTSDYTNFSPSTSYTYLDFYAKSGIFGISSSTSSKLVDTDYRYNINDMYYNISLNTANFPENSLQSGLNRTLLDRLKIEVSNSSNNESHFDYIGTENVQAFTGEIEAYANPHDMDVLGTHNLNSILHRIFTNNEILENAILGSSHFFYGQPWDDEVDAIAGAAVQITPQHLNPPFPLPVQQNNTSIPLDIVSSGMINYNRNNYVYDIKMTEHTLYNFSIAVPELMAEFTRREIDYFDSTYPNAGYHENTVGLNYHLFDQTFNYEPGNPGISMFGYEYNVQSYNILARNQEEAIGLLYLSIFNDVLEATAELFDEYYAFSDEFNAHWDFNFPEGKYSWHAILPIASMASEGLDRNSAFLEQLTAQVEAMTLSALNNIILTTATDAPQEGVHLSFNDLPHSTSLSIQISGTLPDGRERTFLTRSFTTGDDLVINPYGDSLQEGYNIFDFGIWTDRVNSGDHNSRGVYVENYVSSIDINHFGNTRVIDVYDDGHSDNAFWNLEPNQDYIFELSSRGRADITVKGYDGSDLTTTAELTNVASQETTTFNFTTDSTGLTKIAFDFRNHPEGVFSINKAETSLSVTNTNNEIWREETITADIYETFTTIGPVLGNQYNIESRFIKVNNYGIPENLRMNYFEEGEEYTGAYIRLEIFDGTSWVDLDTENNISFNTGIVDVNRRIIREASNGRFEIEFDNLDGFTEFSINNYDADPMTNLALNPFAFNMQIGRGVGSTGSILENESWIHYGREVRVSYQRIFTPPIQALYMDLARTGEYNETAELQGEFFDRFAQIIHSESDLAHMITSRGNPSTRGNMTYYETRIITEFRRNGETYYFLSPILDDEATPILTD